MAKTSSRSANHARGTSLAIEADELLIAAAASVKEARQAKRLEDRLRQIDDTFESDLARALKGDRRAAFDRIMANYGRARTRAYREADDAADLSCRIERAWTRASRALKRLVDDRGIDEHVLAKLYAQRVSQTAKALDAFDALPPPKLRGMS